MLDIEDHLGPGYTAREIPLSGNLSATLVRHRAATNTRGAVLYLHGWIDYFFQTHLAEHFAALGYDFYALDLRHYGRSIRPEAMPYYTLDLREYYEELDAAVALIRGDGHDGLVVMGHSTGGLLAPLWLADRRDAVRPQALILNSPWLELQERWLMRTAGTWLIRGAGRGLPQVVLPHTVSPAYGESLHVDYRGEWNYNLAWKPVKGAPVHMGWLAAIRKAQARVHRGLRLSLPILMLHSDASRLGLTKWVPEAMNTDTVLDVQQMMQWAPALGSDVTTVMVAGALHDVFLSAPPVRGRAFARLDDWLLGRVEYGDADRP
ncbi:MAG: alpha/beta hydrolase [Austwickia sp.]|nr:alpha/beta hydrolase [Austwickia sp.]MBK8435672.1 alpha/beta hydrolase [Austwickia sp.]MBK9100760.1 alpha/beta hydrolase [Austwickia sp.]